MQREDFDASKPVSRGQWAAIAKGLLTRAGEEIPANRWEATRLLVRIREDPDPQPRQLEAPAAERAGGGTGR